MEKVPHWQWLMVIYFFLVGIPVWLVHQQLKKRALAHRTFRNLALYFVAVLGTAFLMHLIVMFLYFKVIFLR